MNKKLFVDFKTFENDILSYEAYMNDFSEKLFKEFDLTAKKLNLSKKIDDLLNGEKVNFSEDQSAIHSQVRNLKKHYPKSMGLIDSRINLDCGWEIVVLGIGGSFEGARLLTECFNINLNKRDVGSTNETARDPIFITGSDPEEIKFKLNDFDLIKEKTFFFVVSKSFTTDETLESLKYALEWSGDPKNFAAITTNPKAAEQYNFLEIIELEPEIGGRYSIWSCASYPANIKMGDSAFESFLEGGARADKDLVKDQDYLGFLKRLSFSDIWLNNVKGMKTRAVLSYSWRLRSFADYVQQLEMESLGKQPNKDSEFKATGQIIFGGYGPTAQHSYFQLLHQGTQNICADILAVQEDPSTLAYAQAITQAKLLSSGAEDLLKESEKINGNVPVNLFLLKKLDPFTLGYLIATWEHRTFITSVMLQINPFDQFGVSSGKIYTKKYLRENGA